MTITQALNKMLVLAKAKLDRAKEKNDAWEIELYEGDIKKIEGQLK